MFTTWKRATVSALCALGLSAAASAQGTSLPTFPFFFPPIAECGTVGTVTSFYDFDGDGQLDECPVWFADSGGAYLVDGIDAFAEGDRVFVDGLVCTICLTTCPASAILSATISECPDPPKGGKGKKSTAERSQPLAGRANVVPGIVFTADAAYSPVPGSIDAFLAAPGGVATTVQGSLNGAPTSGQSFGLSVIPFLFPPIAECGTVGTVTSFFDLDGDGQLDECPVWFADSGGAYLVGGIDAFDEGDRVFVEGLICTTCLTTCPASAILFGEISSCPGGGK